MLGTDALNDTGGGMVFYVGQNLHLTAQGFNQRRLKSPRESILAVAPPAALALAALLLGLYLPPTLDHTLSDAAVLLGGTR